MSEYKDRERLVAAREADMVVETVAVAIESIRSRDLSDEFLDGAIAGLEEIADIFRGRADRWRAKMGQP